MGANEQLESRFRHGIRLHALRSFNGERTGQIMLYRFGRDLDPLDLELLERVWVAVKENDALVDLDSDEALEATLRRELVEIARSNGVSDAETLRDVLLAAMSDQRD
jgi:hypothetical protein